MAYRTSSKSRTPPRTSKFPRTPGYSRLNQTSQVSHWNRQTLNSQRRLTVGTPHLPPPRARSPKTRWNNLHQKNKLRANRRPPGTPLRQTPPAEPRRNRPPDSRIAF